jgi:hypothetical protein
MSLTEGSEVVAAAHEDGLNDLLQAFFTARPRHLRYGTSAFVPSTTVTETHVSEISFPGVPGGIHYAVIFEIPILDLHPDTLGGPLPPGPGQFSVSTKVSLGVLCGPRRQPDPTHEVSLPPNEFKVTSLGLHARGTVVAVGNDMVFQVEAVEIVDVTPDDLESVLECILLLIIQAVLATVRIPFNKLSADVFSLVTVTDGPRIEEDQVKIFGKI